MQALFMAPPTSLIKCQLLHSDRDDHLPSLNLELRKSADLDEITVIAPRYQTWEYRWREVRSRMAPTMRSQNTWKQSHSIWSWLLGKWDPLTDVEWGRASLAFPSRCLLPVEAILEPGIQVDHQLKWESQRELSGGKMKRQRDNDKGFLKHLQEWGWWDGLPSLRT